jgi:hypothetical protein
MPQESRERGGHHSGAFFPNKQNLKMLLTFQFFGLRAWVNAHLCVHADSLNEAKCIDTLHNFDAALAR